MEQVLAVKYMKRISNRMLRKYMSRVEKIRAMKRKRIDKLNVSMNKRVPLISVEDLEKML
jgi:hypothetical protein